MTRGTSTTLTDVLASTRPETANLIAIATGGSPSHLRYCDRDRPLTFSGNLYASRPFEIGEPRIDGESQAEVNLVLPDVDNEIDSWMLTDDFANHRVTRYRVDPDDLTVAISETYRIVDRSRSERSVRFTLAPLVGILAHWRIPAAVLMRSEYPGIRAEGLVG